MVNIHVQAKSNINYKVIDPYLLTLMEREDQIKNIELIIQFKEEITEKDLFFIQKIGIDIKKQFFVIPAIYGLGSINSIIELSNYKKIQWIEYNEDMNLLLEDSTNTISASWVWETEIIDYNGILVENPDGTPKKIDGSGITVALVDSGIQANHPDLDYGEKVILNLAKDIDGNWKDFENTDRSSGHGTNSAGIIGGNGDISAMGRRGVAPGVNLIGISTGEAVAILNAIEALEWVYNNTLPGSNIYNIKVVNCGWGSSYDDSHNYKDSINQITRKIVNENNVIVVFPVGNEGDMSDVGDKAYTNPYSLEPGVIGVAAINKDGNAIAEFSSRGAANDNYTWPDVGAPGIIINSPLFFHPWNSGYYYGISGSSIASAHVSGLCALLWQAAPSLTMSDVRDDYSDETDSDYWADNYTRIHEIEWILKESAAYISPEEDNGVPETNSLGTINKIHDFAQGYGLVNAHKAVGLALTLEELRKYKSDATVWEAKLVYEDIAEIRPKTENTNTLETKWQGEWSNRSDAKYPRYLFIPYKTEKITIDLNYEPNSDEVKAYPNIEIDFNDDGIIDYVNDSSTLQGHLQVEITINDSLENFLGDIWTIYVTGEAQNESSSWEPELEYNVLAKIVLDLQESETHLVSNTFFQSQRARYDFGEPTKTLTVGGISLLKGYYDLSKIPNSDDDEVPDVVDADDDNDDLLDYQEDKNGNGVVDFDETDPLDPDTDNDGYNDKIDAYPLDPGKWQSEETTRFYMLLGFISFTILSAIIILIILYKRKRNDDS
jgi:serine protease AprX